LDVRDHPHGPGRRRLRPSEAGRQAEHAILEPAAVVEHHGDLASRVAAMGRARNPVQAFIRVELQPRLELKEIEQARLAFEEAAKHIALHDVLDRRIVLSQDVEIRDQFPVKRIIDIIRMARWIASWLGHRHGSRRIVSFGSAFISRFHSLMYSRMNISSVAGALIVPSSMAWMRPGMPSPRFM